MAEKKNCGPLDEALDNAMLLLDGARMQIQQAKRLANDPNIMSERIERAKKTALDNIGTVLKELRDLTGNQG
jgi:hypothetical protein